MKRVITPVLFTAMIWTSGQALAADPMPSDSMNSSSTSHQQRMKDCMAREKAKDSSMSKADMKKACRDKMKETTPMDHSTDNQSTPTTEGQPSPSTGSETTPPTSPPK